MSFTRITRILEKTFARAVSGVAACTIGGAILHDDALDCVIVGAIIGGINGLVETIFDEIKSATSHEEITRDKNGNTKQMQVPHPAAKSLSNIANLATFGTPALAWFLLNEAKNNDLSVGTVFATYWTGTGILTGGTLLLGCCCCAISAARSTLFKMMSLLTSESFFNIIAMPAMDRLNMANENDDPMPQARRREGEAVEIDIDGFPPPPPLRPIGIRPTNLFVDPFSDPFFDNRRMEGPRPMDIPGGPSVFSLS